MKQFFGSLLLSLLLTGVIGSAFWLFQQGTFFDPAVNWITTACLGLLVAVVWYLFFSNLWYHHIQRKKRILDALPKIEETPKAEPESPIQPEPEPQPVEPEPVHEPEAANGPEGTVFIPPQPSTEEQPSAEGWTTAPESAQRPAQKPTRSATSHGKTAEEKAEEKARKLQQAAQEKQARRVRKMEEDVARQQKKLEELRAQAAQKKASAHKRVDWKNSEQNDQ